MESIIRLSNVTKRFGKQVALDHVSYDVPRGVVFALLGENGAGKTTTIRTLLGLERPDQGTATVLGLASDRGGREIRRRIGYVPENPVLYDWMKVEEIGWFTSGFYADGFLPRYIELARGFDLPLDKKLKSLSKGMRAKVSLALAMAHQPELLIMDEPTSGLDTLVRRSFLESMVDVAAEGNTVFLSSHQIVEVERVADIVAIMDRGRILAVEPLEQLKSRFEQWVVTFSESVTKPLSIDANIVHETGDGRRRQLMVSDPSPDALWQLRDRDSVVEVDVNVPTLEDIFVALMKAKEQNDDKPAVSARSEGEGAVQ